MKAPVHRYTADIEIKYADRSILHKGLVMHHKTDNEDIAKLLIAADFRGDLNTGGTYLVTITKVERSYNAS